MRGLSPDRLDVEKELLHFNCVTNKDLGLRYDVQQALALLCHDIYSNEILEEGHNKHCKA